MSFAKPSHLSYEQHFERECEFFQQALTREADSLHHLEDRRAGTIQVICDLIVQLEILGWVAETMASKSPMCPTVLISPAGYFSESTTIYRDINYTVAGQLEAIHDDLAFILDCRE
ncbi:hypothetical protein PENCOP_c009G08757 [Penicillium coprophilum]|uniref:Uncharacterized protein n=1 Tax=Penicillium coprophilum TaxID=36646 RepID=A0A1V6UGY1_9EURO|nr:hypothetical protein PENCOP_c009G08757 [Penicillium coprophilum]